MFGVLQGGCTLDRNERREWMAHIYGTCLALRRDHGQLARLTTNYDAALLSVLYDAQADRPMARDANLCVLRPRRLPPLLRRMLVLLRVLRRLRRL